MAYTLLSALLLVSLLSTVEAADGDLNAACKSGGACTSNDHVCDTTRTTPLCKAKATKPCTVVDDCVAGVAACTGAVGSKVCDAACDTSISTTASDLCTPKAAYLGGTCGTCTAANTECSNSKCVCKTGYTAVYSTLTCLASLGTTCSVDADCYDSTNNVCDLVAKVCRIRPTKTCTGNTDKCVTGAACTAALNTQCECLSTYAVDSTISCKPKLGTTCTPTAALLCDGGDNACDPYSNTCKIGATKTCATGATTCATGATCATSGGTTTCTCEAATTAAETSKFFCQKKIASGAACTWYDKCTDADSVCDLQLGKCAKKENTVCTASDTCVSGSTCDSVTTKCKCSTGFTATSGLCVAVAGKAGGACSSGACTDTNAECKTTPTYGGTGNPACFCKTNFQFNPTDGTCKAVVSQNGASSLSKMTGFFTVMAALSLGFHL